MYESFYQLTSNPFRLAPDPNFCFTHAGYKRAREYLEYALAQGEGFVMVTGRPGTGKTMLAETFIRGVDISNVTAKRITASNYSADDLLRAVAYAYDLDAIDVDKATLRHRIQRYFLQQEKIGKRVLLIIDEAQALQHQALEELRILADLQTESRLMLQLFLIGQERLQDLMRTPDMEQFQQRVIANYHLVPLNLLDARAYIEFRLLQAGWRGDPAFSSKAVLSIYRLSKGVPRHINKICNRLLLLGYGKGSHSIEDDDVRAISLEMRDELLTPMGADVLPVHVDSAASIPEIRDGLLTMDDLAIRVDNLSSSMTAISEASKLAEQDKQAFLHRHRNDPQVWEMAQEVHGPALSSTVASAENEPLPVVPAGIIHAGDDASSSLSGKFRWREALVMTAAMFAITTISIAALPTILGEKHKQEEIASSDKLESHASAGARINPMEQADVPLTRSQDNRVVATPVSTPTQTHQETGLFASEESSQINTVQSTDRPSLASTQTAAIDTVVITEPLVTAAAETSVEAIFPAPMPVNEEIAVKLPTATLIKADPIETAAPSLDVRPETLVTKTTAANTAPEESQVVEYDGLVEVLLAQGRACIDEYRLLTPLNDNAYGYFRAVLVMDPENQQAQAGIQDIVSAYINLTYDAVNHDDTALAKLYVTRGLSIQPDNRKLLVLGERVEQLASNTIAQSDDVVIIASEQQPDATTDNTTGLFSGFSSFFRKHGVDQPQHELTHSVDWGDG